MKTEGQIEREQKRKEEKLKSELNWEIENFLWDLTCGKGMSDKLDNLISKFTRHHIVVYRFEFYSLENKVDELVWYLKKYFKKHMFTEEFFKDNNGYRGNYSVDLVDFIDYRIDSNEYKIEDYIDDVVEEYKMCKRSEKLKLLLN